MARIRTIKPEFWTDDLLGSLSREGRLLFIATWNLADDEGLLRWTAPFLKGAVFPFDDDLSVKKTLDLMKEVEAAGIIFPYTGGRSQQALAYIINFHKHQKINRPSPSRLPPPPIQDQKVKEMYGRRDGLICHLCLQKLDEKPSAEYDFDFLSSPDHLVPISKGGTDFPSNIKAAHLTCNKGRRDRDVDEYRVALRSGKTAAQQRYPERFSELLTDLPPGDSVTELGTGKGNRERIKDKGKERDHSRAARFEEFWSACPKRVGKGKVEGLFTKIVGEGVDAELLITSMGQYAKSQVGKDATYIAHPSTWLSQQRWLDEISPGVPTATIHILSDEMKRQEQENLKRMGVI